MESDSIYLFRGSLTELSSRLAQCHPDPETSDSSHDSVPDDGWHFRFKSRAICLGQEILSRTCVHVRETAEGCLAVRVVEHLTPCPPFRKLALLQFLAILLAAGRSVLIAALNQHQSCFTSWVVARCVLPGLIGAGILFPFVLLFGRSLAIERVRGQIVNAICDTEESSKSVVFVLSVRHEMAEYTWLASWGVCEIVVALVIARLSSIDASLDLPLTSAIAFAVLFMVWYLLHLWSRAKQSLYSRRCALNADAIAPVHLGAGAIGALAYAGWLLIPVYEHSPPTVGLVCSLFIAAVSTFVLLYALALVARSIESHKSALRSAHFMGEHLLEMVGHSATRAHWRTVLDLAPTFCLSALSCYVTALLWCLCTCVLTCGLVFGYNIDLPVISNVWQCIVVGCSTLAPPGWDYLIGCVAVVCLLLPD